MLVKYWYYIVNICDEMAKYFFQYWYNLSKCKNLNTRPIFHDNVEKIGQVIQHITNTMLTGNSLSNKLEILSIKSHFL